MGYSGIIPARCDIRKHLANIVRYAHAPGGQIKTPGGPGN